MSYLTKAYVVFRGGGKEEAIGKLCGATGKFLGKSSRPQGTSNQTNSISLQQGNFAEESDSATVSAVYGKPELPRILRFPQGVYTLVWSRTVFN